MAVLIGMLAIAGAAGFLYMKQAHGPAQEPVSAPANGTGGTPAGEGHGMGGPHGGRGMGGHGAGMGANETCNAAGLNNETIGRNIKWLFDNHDVFKYNLTVYPENMTIIWIITGPNKTAVETLVSHIMQMECVIEHGGTPRPNDPLFQLDAQISRKYVHTEIQWINETTIKVVKKADNDCAFEVIKLHAEIVKGFFEIGRQALQQDHAPPEEAYQICQPYLNQTTPTG